MDGELIKTWKRNKTKVKLFYQGTTKLGYQLLEGKEVIFEGNEFRPSPIHCIDSIESVRDLLGFLTCEKGDTDPEYFKDYTQKQFAWVDSTMADDLRIYLYDAENRR